MPGQRHSYAAPLLLLGCVIFGLGSLIVKFVEMGSYAIAFWRLAIAAIVFGLLTRFFGQKFPKNKKAIYTTLLSGVFLAFDLALWHESIHAVGPGISTLLNSLQIFFLSLIGFFFFGERLNKIQILSLILALFGVALIGSPEFNHNKNALWGFISGITSGALLALSMVYIRKTHQIENFALFPLMMTLSIGGMMALILPTFLLNADSFYPHTWQDVGLTLIYGIIIQCFAWGIIAYAIPILPLSLTGLLLLFEPVAALLIDYLWLNKTINHIQWTGVVLTLIAIYLGSNSSKSR